MDPDVLVGDADEIRKALVRDFHAEAMQALAANGSFSVALPGGSVAVNTFSALSSLDVDWRRLHFFWADERAVDPSDPESNYGAARRTWLEPARIPAHAIHRMPADSVDLERAAASYSDELVRVLGSPPRLDYVLLGVGPDGHVASLFPGHVVLAEESRWVAAVVDAPKPPPRRLTLTIPVLANAGRLVVVAYGASKAAMLRDAVERPDSTLPVALVMRRAKRPLVLADKEAGSLFSFR
jgi:6-phosphogluconolactonase